MEEIGIVADAVENTVTVFDSETNAMPNIQNAS